MKAKIIAERPPTKSANSLILLALVVAYAALWPCHATSANSGGDSKDLSIIQVGNEPIPIRAEQATADPLNATYTIEGMEIPLLNGRHEVWAAPNSATKIRTWVFGEPVLGDLNDDGVDEAVLLLVHAPGGSGMFYYVAAALNVNGAYRGTNGVLLGDRIAPQNVAIRNGVVIASYADRRPDESMTTPPSVGISKYLTLEGGVLAEIEPLGQGEQVLEGWVTIGREVRSFLPGSGETDLWLLGSSPAVNEIMTAHRKALPDRKRYAPLFMVLAGQYDDAPTDGFGAVYEGAFLARRSFGYGRGGTARVS
jgi:hypothetical protein